MDNDNCKAPIGTRIECGAMVALLWISTFFLAYVVIFEAVNESVSMRILGGLCVLGFGLVSYGATFLIGMLRIALTGYEWKD